MVRISTHRYLDLKSPRNPGLFFASITDPVAWILQRLAIFSSYFEHSSNTVCPNFARTLFPLRLHFVRTSFAK